jgi:hypothetical protein
MLICIMSATTGTPKTSVWKIMQTLWPEHGPKLKIVSENALVLPIYTSYHVQLVFNMASYCRDRERRGVAGFLRGKPAGANPTR